MGINLIGVDGLEVTLREGLPREIRAFAFSLNKLFVAIDGRISSSGASLICSKRSAEEGVLKIGAALIFL